MNDEELVSLIFFKRKGVKTYRLLIMDYKINQNNLKQN